MKKYFIRFLTVVVIVVLTYAMTAPWPQQSQQETGKQAESHSAKQQDTAYVKPHAGIEMQYYSAGAMQVGEARSLELSFTLDQQADSLLLTVETEPGLQLDSAERVEFTGVRETRTSIQVSALQPGRFNITINALIRTAGQKQARSFVIPVTVSGDAGHSPDTPSGNPGAESTGSESGVIAMPAVETTD